jgi:tripartite-type tricarboxylate transporter receptor subunit TctC
VITLTRLFCALLASIAVSSTSAAGEADAYPTKPIRLIVPFAAGGVADVVARILSDKVAAELGQPVIVDNRSGANSVIGTQAAARAEPDGYTILQMVSTGAIIVSLQQNIPYDLERDFAPVVGIGSIPLALAVPGSSNIHSINDLVALARSSPNGVNYASGSAGSLGHLAAALLVQQLKITATHIPYRGGSGAMQALMGSQVDFFFATTVDTVEFAKAGKIRLLAVTSDERLPQLPDVPTMKELGYAGFNPTVWQGYVVPALTPDTVINRLHDAFADAVAQTDVRERFDSLGVRPNVTGPAAFGKLIREEAVHWRRVIQENHISFDN